MRTLTVACLVVACSSSPSAPVAEAAVEDAPVMADAVADLPTNDIAPDLSDLPPAQKDVSCASYGEFECSRYVAGPDGKCVREPANEGHHCGWELSCSDPGGYCHDGSCVPAPPMKCSDIDPLWCWHNECVTGHCQKIDSPDAQPCGNQGQCQAGVCVGALPCPSMAGAGASQYDKQCKGGNGCRSLPCPVCTCGCTICDGAKCVESACDDSCLAKPALVVAPLAWLTGPDPELAVPVAAQATAQLVGAGDGKDVELALLAEPPPGLVADRVVVASESSAWLPCAEAPTSETAGPMVLSPEVGVWSVPAPQTQLLTTILHVALVRVTEDAAKVRRYQWIALSSEGTSLLDDSGQPGAVVLLTATAWPPLLATEVQPLGPPWAGVDWVTGVDMTLGP